MSRQPSSRPALTPQFCFNERAIRDFLRLSRSAFDDSIVEHLNGILTPARKGFDSSSPHTKPSGPANTRQLSPSACQSFKDKVMFPSWQTRSDVLNYCAGVATSPDPDDPDLLLRQVESARDRERVVDERLDPYSARFFPKEARTESLAMLMRNERAIENIVRMRTWGLVQERCESSLDPDNFEDALNAWRSRGDTR